MKKPFLILVIASSIICLGADDSDKKSPKEALESLQQAVKEAVAKFKDGTAKDQKSIAETSKAADLLFQKWKANPRDISVAYIDTLKGDADLLAEASKGKEPEQASKALEAVQKDLDAKVKFARGALGVAGGFGASVQVEVRTRRNGEEVPGYKVRCNPWRYKDNNPPLYPFGSPTNDAKRSLPPGYYRLWLEKGEKEVLSQPVSFGEQGEPKEKLVIDVPP